MSPVQSTMSSEAAYWMDVWRSIPSMSYFDDGFRFRLPPDRYCYTTITGWRVSRVSRPFYWRVESLPPLSVWKKLGWNTLAIVLLLPQLLAKFDYPPLMWLLRHIPGWGLYVVLTQLFVYPAHRWQIKQWNRHSSEIEVEKVVTNNRATFFFFLEGDAYSFKDFNSILAKRNDKVDPPLFFRVLLKLEQAPRPTVDSPPERTCPVIFTDNWSKLCRRAEFSWIRTPLKVMLGLVWLRFIWVPLMNGFFLTCALLLRYTQELQENHYKKPWAVARSISVGDWGFLVRVIPHVHMMLLLTPHWHWMIPKVFNMFRIHDYDAKEVELMEDLSATAKRQWQPNDSIQIPL